jgi:hypothetical protein
MDPHFGKTDRIYGINRMKKTNPVNPVNPVYSFAV